MRSSFLLDAGPHQYGGVGDSMRGRVDEEYKLSVSILTELLLLGEYLQPIENIHWRLTENIAGRSNRCESFGKDDWTGFEPRKIHPCPLGSFFLLTHPSGDKDVYRSLQLCEHSYKVGYRQYSLGSPYPYSSTFDSDCASEC